MLSFVLLVVSMLSVSGAECSVVVAAVLGGQVYGTAVATDVAVGCCLVYQESHCR